MESLRMNICSAQNAAKVLISKRKHLLVSFGAIFDSYPMGRTHLQRCESICMFALVVQCAALAAIHLWWPNINCCVLASLEQDWKKCIWRGTVQCNGTEVILEEFSPTSRLGSRLYRLFIR